MTFQCIEYSRIRNYLVAILLVLIQGCAVLLPPVEYDYKTVDSYSIEGVPVTLYYLPEDASTLPLIAESVRTGITRASRWGEITSPVVVMIYPDHHELEKAVHQTGYKWLKAWATEERISLQSPRSWPVVRKKNVMDLMTHELTHVVHYQTAGIKASRSSRNDPFWFREGLASYTAGQGYRYYSRKRLLRILRDSPAFDPMNPSRKDIRNRVKLAYSSAYHLVTYLIEKYGEENIRELLQGIARLDSFEKAFKATYSFKSEQLPNDEWFLWLGKK
jgi:hypothetical protein